MLNKKEKVGTKVSTFFVGTDVPGGTPNPNYLHNVEKMVKYR